MEALVAIINKISDPTVLILLGVCTGLGFLLFKQMSWARDDRDKLIPTLEAIRNAIQDVKLFVAMGKDK